MKKFLLSLVCVCLCCAFAFADVVVVGKNKTVRYPDGTKLKIHAQEDITIIYKGTVVFVPKGESVSVRCSEASENNAVFVTSEKGFKNVQIGDKTFSSKSGASIVASKNGNVSVQTGTVSVANESGQVSIVPAGKTTKVDNKEALAQATAAATANEVANASSSSSESPSAVAESNSTDVAEVANNESSYEQASKDEDLSPSAPRN